MNQRLLTFVLRTITGLLPADRRDQYLHDWLAEYDAEPRPFLHALSFLPAAYQMRAPFEVRPGDVTRVHLLDRFMLAQGKFIWAFAAFVFITYLLALLAFGGWTHDSLNWLIGAVMFLIYAGSIVRTGFGVDLPWLRMTRAGSFIQLSLAVSALAVLVQDPPKALGSAALLLLFTLWTWTGYWGVRRPLKKSGFLSR